jgi:hypothetical protein
LPGSGNVSPQQSKFSSDPDNPHLFVSFATFCSNPLPTFCEFVI